MLFFSLHLMSWSLSIIIGLTCAIGGSERKAQEDSLDGVCIDNPENDKEQICDFFYDDVAEEYTTLENEEEEETSNFASKSTARVVRRKRRSVLLKEPLEKNFNFTDDKKYFTDLLDGTGAHDKTVFHKEAPEGYADTDRTKLLLFKVTATWYPPFTYRGFYGRSSWQQIPMESLLKKRNRSFMLLEHVCEHEAERAAEKECAKKEYPKLPSCKSEDQSPINIDTKKARDSSLKEFEFSNLLDEAGNVIGYPYMMSVPWDGTDLLTVELLGDQNPPGVEKGSISGRKLYLERIHIHYGENETVGSEHTLDKFVYSMELQFIFSFRTNANGVREPTDLQYWDLLMQYYTNAGKKNRLKNVHIISLWVRVIDDETFTEGKGEWHDQWNQNASKAFDSLSRAARKFWALHNTLQKDVPMPAAEKPIGPIPDPTKRPATSKPEESPPPNQKPFKYRAVISTGPETLDLGAFFPPKVFDPRLRRWRDSIYYNYKGSLTHPPCFGYVEWDIYDRPLYIPTSMWLNFLYIDSEFDDTKFIAGNYRLPRHVYVEALDNKKGVTWTPERIEERRKTIEKMEKRDLRRSKPSGSETGNYDYYENEEELQKSSGASQLKIILFLSVLNACSALILINPLRKCFSNIYKY